MSNYPNLNPYDTNQNKQSKQTPQENIAEYYDPNYTPQPGPVSGPQPTSHNPINQLGNQHGYHQNSGQNYYQNNQYSNQGYNQGYAQGYPQQYYAPNDPNNPNYEVYNNRYSSRQRWIMMGVIFLFTCLICGSIILFRRSFKNQQKYPHPYY